ncbi:MAG: gliding motility lipoprotein GldH [Bacteroidota bacterium]|nr:gliding motility lipoprotein GldH [Bacteroidota bacterium]
MISLFSFFRSFFICTVLFLFLFSCTTIDLYERVVPISQHKWNSDFKPTFAFIIKDTTTAYQLFIILRHNEKYNYNNIWLNLTAGSPVDSVQKFMVELPLATNEKGWLGSGMDDIYEHRIGLTLDPSKFNFNAPGTYNFTIEHTMREDPLDNVMNVGIRLEKK